MERTRRPLSPRGNSIEPEYKKRKIDVEAPFPFMDLPVELQLHIISFIGMIPGCLYTLCKVSKHMKCITTTIIRAFTPSRRARHSFSAYRWHQTCKCVLTQLTYLKTIDISNSRVPDSVIRFFPCSLTSLNLSSTALTARGLESIQSYCPALQILNARDCLRLNSVDTLPLTLRELYIDRIPITSISFANLPSTLRIVSIAECRKLTRVISDVHCLPYLTTLYLGKLNHSVEFRGRGPGQLREVDISYLDAIYVDEHLTSLPTRANLVFAWLGPSVTHLYMAGVNLHANYSREIANLENLTFLDLGTVTSSMYYWNIIPILANMTSLRTIKMNKCDFLYQLQKFLPASVEFIT